MATLVYSQNWETFQHMMQLNPQSQTYMSDTGCDDLWIGKVPGFEFLNIFMHTDSQAAHIAVSLSVVLLVFSVNLQLTEAACDPHEVIALFTCETFFQS
jgi:hypothetical protein